MWHLVVPTRQVKRAPRPGRRDEPAPSMAARASIGGPCNDGGPVEKPRGETEPRGTDARISAKCPGVVKNL